MAEQFRSITEARKELPSLSQTVQRCADRFVITNQGKPQAVKRFHANAHQIMMAEMRLAMNYTPQNAPCFCGSGAKFKHCHGKLKMK